MAPDLVLLTGATGLVGFRVLTELLDQGYKIRLAVRSNAKIDAIQKSLPDKYAVDELDFTIVPNMAIEGAFDKAVDGVTYIIHVAAPAPAPSDDLEATMIKPSIDMTLSILNSALKQPNVKKVVITSSVGAVFPLTEQKNFDADNIEPDPEGPYPNVFFAYLASKTLALSATRKFISERNNRFDVINVMPSFVIGPNGFASNRQEYEAGSNMIALAPLLGVKFPEPRPGMTCHVDDVARVHVAALRPDVSGHHNFGVTFNGPNTIEWNDVVDIVKKRLPKLVEQGVFPMGGAVVSQPGGFEASKTERILGIKFKTFEDMVVDLASDYARRVATVPA